MQKKPAIIIAVLCVISLGLGYWYGLPKESSNPPLPPPPGPKVPVPPVKVPPENGELIADPVLREELVKVLKIEEAEITPKKLSGLTELNLSKKDIKSIQGLQHCVTLKSLNLAYNKIEDLSPIVNMGKLETLLPYGNPFKELPDLSALKKVKSLDFSYCENLRDISGIKNMVWLETLYLQKVYLSDISPIAGLINLKTLGLQYNKIEDLSPIVNMGKLETLLPYGNPFKELPDLSALKKVKSLDFTYCKNLRDISGIKNMVWLETLHFKEVYLSDISPIAGLINLKTLSLQYNKIEDLSPIVNMGKLENLYLDNNLIQNVPDLSKQIFVRSLSFENNDLRDISGLKAMDGLQTLNITNNPLLSDLDPLTGLKRLKNLTAANCKITNTMHLRLMKNLQSLNIQGNPVPKAELQTLKTALPRCKILHN